MESLQLEALLAHVPDIVVSVPYLGSLDVTRALLALGIFIVLNVAFWALRAIVLSRLVALSKKTSIDIDDVFISAVSGVRSWVYTIISVYIALQVFTLPALLSTMLLGGFLFSVVWQLIEVATCFVDYAAQRMLHKDEDGDGVVDPNAATATHMVTLLARIILWGFGGIFLLSNLGVEVTSLIAGLGIGGIAVAFALQGILSDLFSSFSLYFDKPFRVGDYIVIGEHSGTVERIGIKTTRIRTLQGEELVVSNAELTATRVQNFKRMQERRIVFSFGVTYETAYEKLEQVNAMVEKAVGQAEGLRFDRSHFTSFGDSALLFEVVYFIDSSDYTAYLNAQQQINFSLMQQFAEAGIEFAYPTQTIYHRAIS
ncbi:mechanosensitive ion channel family protein [Candidatus Kaiserbacteria bacterium]|nr:mechanosensitive ion channel family protein [Candidatus Kaiserbacteria bacterium]MCB9811466.1 mechanosensitive ion channel family protein [Candidatus Nomurabacteria bacterium]